MNRWDDDTDYQEHIIDRVEPYADGSGWSIGFDGAGCGVGKEYGVEPHVGDVVRLYPGGWGCLIRGILLNGREVYYRTEAEQDAKNKADNAAALAKRRRKYEETGRAKVEADYLTLPKEFKERFDGFRRRNKGFWDLEGYEMFCCTEAVKFAQAFKTPEHLQVFRDAKYEQQKQMLPDWDDNHSGNTFGAACRLAYWWLVKPENVVLEHGALCPMLGCREYGCQQAQSAPEGTQDDGTETEGR